MLVVFFEAQKMRGKFGSVFLKGENHEGKFGSVLGNSEKYI